MAQRHRFVTQGPSTVRLLPAGTHGIPILCAQGR